MNTQTTEAKSIWSEIANFTGEFIDQKDNSSEFFLNRKEVGVLTDEEKKIFTLLIKKTEKIDAITISLVGPEGLAALKGEDPVAIELYENLLNKKATPELAKKYNDLHRQFRAISKVFWGTIDYRLSEEDPTLPTVRIEPGWKIVRGIDQSDLISSLGEIMPFGFPGFGFSGFGFEIMVKKEEKKTEPAEKK